MYFQAVKTVRRHRPQLVENLVHLSPFLFPNPLSYFNPFHLISQPFYYLSFIFFFHNPFPSKSLKIEHFVENLVTHPLPHNPDTFLSQKSLGESIGLKFFILPVGVIGHHLSVTVPNILLTFAPQPLPHQSFYQGTNPRHLSDQM